MDDNKPINKNLDAELRRLPRMNYDFQRTVENVYAALFSNVKIEWPEGEGIPKTMEDRLLHDIFIQLCTHGMVGEILLIRPNTDPTRKEPHEPRIESTQRFIGTFHTPDGFDINWKPEKENKLLHNVEVFVHNYPIEEDVVEEVEQELVTESKWVFNGWLSAYLPREVQFRSMNNSSFWNFIRLSEGYLRRSMNIPEMMKGMPDTRLAHEVDIFLANTPDLKGNIVLPHEYNSQISFAKSASRANPPNMPGWNYSNVLPSGMTEDVIMPSQISSLALNELRAECYINLIESQINLAQQIRRAVESAVIYFYAHFLQKDHYNYYVMMEARRQIESICLFLEHKVTFTEVSYWLVFPDIAPNDVNALLNVVGLTEMRENTSEMNEFLREQTTFYAITDDGFVNMRKRKSGRDTRMVETRSAKKQRLAIVDKSKNARGTTDKDGQALELTTIRESPILAAAFAPFIVKEPKNKTLTTPPVFSWAPLKNILYKEEKNAEGKRTKSSASERKKKPTKKSTTAQ